jgi:LmbE family N-acetylglucosaminyl deacetylase
MNPAMNPPMTPPARRFTIVSFHAHPDDEALLTGGTLARAAAQGHRVVIVVATAGEVGLADQSFAAAGLAEQRRDELAKSAAAIGAARLEVLGYADSGYLPAPPDQPPVGAPRRQPSHRLPFSKVEVRTAATELARLLGDEGADVLTIYDPAGGYGHPDHVKVHRVGVLAAQLAGTPVVLEATVDRQALLRGVRALTVFARWVRLPAMPDLSAAYTDRRDLTHCVDVRRYLSQKRTAMRAHASQATSDQGTRTLALLLRLPTPLARRVLGREWFREIARPPGGPLLDDIFASLRKVENRDEPIAGRSQPDGQRPSES